jgi:hypothetical protein
LVAERAFFKLRYFLLVAPSLQIDWQDETAGLGIYNIKVSFPFFLFLQLKLEKQAMGNSHLQAFSLEAFSQRNDDGLIEKLR